MLDFLYCKDEFYEKKECLIIDFTQYFQGFKIYRAYDALQKNEDTEEATYYKECAAKRDEILQRMLEHSNNLHM